MGGLRGTGPRAAVSRWVVRGGQAPALRYGDGLFAGDGPPRCGIAAVFHGKRGPVPRQDWRSFICRARACPSPPSPEKIIGEVSSVGRGPVPRHLHPKKNRCNRFENYGIIFLNQDRRECQNPTGMRGCKPRLRDLLESYRDARFQTAPTGFVRILAYGVC